MCFSSDSKRNEKRKRRSGKEKKARFMPDKKNWKNRRGRRTATKGKGYEDKGREQKAPTEVSAVDIT